MISSPTFSGPLLPDSDNAYDIGSGAASWQDIFIDGTAYLNNVDINGGAIDGVVLGADDAQDAYVDDLTSGPVTATGTTTDGSTNIFVGNDSSDATVFEVNTDGDTTIGGDLTTGPTAQPSVDFADSDGTDSDVNARIYADLTDTGSGTEDADMYFQQQIAGAMTTWLHADADGNIDFQNRKIVTTGRIVWGTTTLSDTGPTDNLDVSGVNVVFVDTGDNNVTLGGMTGGVSGQVLHVVITDATNDAVLEHAESTGNQDIYLQKGADETFSSSYGGWTLICNGTHWYQVGNVDTDT
jgi:hypothetical protein